MAEGFSFFVCTFAVDMEKRIHRVMLCLASNCRQEYYMAEARQRLEGLLGNLRFTSAHWTEPVSDACKRIGQNDRDACKSIDQTTPPLWGTLPTQEENRGMYLNQLAVGETMLGADDLNEKLKEIEQSLDRKHDGSGRVTIDIDLLLYDDVRYHLRDWERDYVKDLLPELTSFA